MALADRVPKGCQKSAPFGTNRQKVHDHNASRGRAGGHSRKRAWQPRLVSRRNLIQLSSSTPRASSSPLREREAPRGVDLGEEHARHARIPGGSPLGSERGGFSVSRVAYQPESVRTLGERSKRGLGVRERCWHPWATRMAETLLTGFPENMSD